MLLSRYGEPVTVLWEVFKFAIPTAIALIALVVSAAKFVREERYRPLWTDEVRDEKVLLWNRTREDATDVSIDWVDPEGLSSGVDRTALVLPDAFITFEPEGVWHPNEGYWQVTWVRNRTGVRYRRPFVLPTPRIERARRAWRLASEQYRRSSPRARRMPRV